MSDLAVSAPFAGGFDRPLVNPWIIAMTVTLATFMEVLDSSIANVALPHMAGSLASTPNEATWVLTSYLVSSAVVLPMSGWISDLIGRKRFYMTCVIIFTVSSLLCGLCTTLPMLVICRILQGAGGGGLQPSEQAILADTFKPEQRSMGFAIYGMAVVVAPAIGPTLGGWITDNLNWHWIFFINIPIGIVSLVLTQRLIHDPPYLKAKQFQAKQRTDYLGISAIVIGVGLIQFVLDKGQELDWLSSMQIRVALATGLAGLVILIWREWTFGYPIIKLHLLAMRNFATSTLFNFILGMVLSGSTILIPQFLQVQLGYTAERAGWALSPGGIALALMMPVAGFAATKFDPRKVVAFGFLVTSISLFSMTRIYSGIDFQSVVWLRVFQVLGIPFIFIPISTLAYVGISPKDNNQVSGITNFVRNLGGGIGVSFLSTFLARHEQISKSDLAAHLTKGSIFFDRYFAMLSHGAHDPMATHRALAQLDDIVQGQANTLAFMNAFHLLGVVILLLTPLPFLMKRPTKQDLQRMAGMH
jgi:MFS transporter, DHA2 family, multidrug resistance protein